MPWYTTADARRDAEKQAAAKKRERKSPDRRRIDMTNIEKIRTGLQPYPDEHERQAALAALAELGRSAAEPVATVLGIVVEWTGEQPPEAGTKLYAAPPAPVADARIAELERECSQWRDELRIYRETENKRIAELETDLELARRDVERYRWLRDESGNDHHTPWCAVGYSDPTWLTGEHLDAAIDAARAGNGGGV